jgi:hypothetical protein
MSGRLPEHIDEIESFYKENLEGFESFPSPDLWSKIDASLSKVVDSKVGATQKSIWKSKWFLGGIGVVALTAIVVASFYIKTVGVSDSGMDSINKPLSRPDVKNLTPQHEDENASPIHSPSKVPSGVKNKKALENVETELSNVKNIESTQQNSVEKFDSATVPQKINETVEPLEDNLRPVVDEEHKEDPEPSKKNMIERLKEKNRGKNDLFLKKDK